MRLTRVVGDHHSGALRGKYGHSRKDDNRIHDRGAAALSGCHGRFHGPAQLHPPRLQAHQLHRRPRCSRRRSWLGAGHQRAGRDAAEARRHFQRYLPLHQRIRRSSRRHGFRGVGRALPYSAGISARPLFARLRSARWLEQHRHQRSRGQHFLGAARALGHGTPDRRMFPAAGRPTGLRRLCDLRCDHHAGAHRRPRCPRLHARSRLRRIHPDASEPAHSGGRLGVRDQCLE